MPDNIKLIIGLANPGQDYAKTRHNAGAWFVNALAEQNQQSFQTEKKLHGQLCQIELDNYACRLAIPSTYMNHSGRTVQAISQFYKLTPQEILVAHDEIDLPPGTARLKFAGGHGGQNGLRDIFSHMGKDFYRLRIGVGHPGNSKLVHDYVLHAPSKHDQSRIDDAINEALRTVPLLLAGKSQEAMQQLHTTTN